MLINLKISYPGEEQSRDARSVLAGHKSVEVWGNGNVFAVGAQEVAARLRKLQPG